MQSIKIASIYTDARHGRPTHAAAIKRQRQKTEQHSSERIRTRLVKSVYVNYPLEKKVIEKAFAKV